MDPLLQLNGLFATKPVKFLGMSVQLPTANSDNSRSTVLSRLQAMLTAVDDSLLSRRQKLLLYSAGICPWLTWQLLIQEFPISWMEKHIDPLATRYMKNGLASVGLATQPFSTSLLARVASISHASTRSFRCHASASS